MALAGQVEITSGIDWKRLAEPQIDQYDTRITLQFRKWRGHRRLENDGGPAIFDGKVLLRRTERSLLPEHCIPAPFDHPHIAECCELIRAWPAVFKQCQELIESVSVYTNTQNDDGRYLFCASDGGPTVASTVDHPVAFAEALVHEMAHNKLISLGVRIEWAERMIRNPPEQRFKSPVRYDCLRPMTAVVHAEYSFCYIAGLYVHLMKAGHVPEEHKRYAGRLLSAHVPKLEFGRQVISNYADLDRVGIEFMDGLFGWLERLLEDGNGLLRDFGIPMKPFTHPLDETNTEQLGIGPIGGTGCDARSATTSNLSRWRPQRVATVETHELLDEAVLYSPEANLALSLNSSARQIWDLCDGQRTVAEISAELERLYGLHAGALREDIGNVVIHLQRNGVLAVPEIEICQGLKTQDS